MRAGRGARGIAIQLTNSQLIASFESSVRGNMRDAVILQDAGQRAVGRLRDATPYPSNLRFSGALAHLRPSVSEAYVERVTHSLLREVEK